MSPKLPSYLHAPAGGTAGRRAPAAVWRRAQAGISMVEMLVVVLISMLMMAGVLGIVYGSRQNFTAQNQMAQLLDNERLVMTMVTNVVQNAGYFFDPAAELSTAALPTTTSVSLGASNGGATYVFGTAGQAIYSYAASSANNTSDQIIVRFKTGLINGASDGVPDCRGQTSSATQSSVNILYVNTSTQNLYCTTIINGGTASTTLLATGVENMSVTYGVATNSGATLQYFTSASMTANWASVVSMQVTLTFAPPFNAVTAAGSSGYTTAPTLTRTIDLLNRI